MKKLKGFALDRTPRGIATCKMIEYVEKNSNGRLKIELHPNETFGTEHDIIKAVQAGSLDIQIVGANMIANTIPQFAALSLPFLTESIDEGLAVLDGSIGNQLKTLGEEHGFKIITDIALGYAQMTNNIRPIHSPADLEGLKVRSPNDRSFVETFKTFGSAVSIITYTDIYDGLAQGVIEGQFNPLANIFELKIDEVQDYLAMTNHAFYVAYIIMNKDVFDRLDDELQQILLQAGKEGKACAREFLMENEKQLQERANQAFTGVTYPDMKPFQEAVQPMYKQMEDMMGTDCIKRIQDFLRSYRSKHKVVY
ncbi:TRAP transporter substrate-binding protein [Anaerobacillus sp. MEB173]|uniref:TRAP transporter substrate-binding protein n=1 Tax=Anaerobacillus sp. MEB173 TaxID=3383345 RepID=UPI003F92FE06